MARRMEASSLATRESIPAEAFCRGHTEESRLSEKYYWRTEVSTTTRADRATDLAEPRRDGRLRAFASFHHEPCEQCATTRDHQINRVHDALLS